MADRVVLLDFDGTLGLRPGLWSACVLEVVDELIPGHQVSLEQVRDGLRNGFPWHRPTESHHHLSEPDAWWAPVLALLKRTILAAGLNERDADRCAQATRHRFADPTRGWELFPDTIPALERLRAAGWSCAILSNHIPELPQLVTGLGLAPYMDEVVSSASIGYEKPHPEAFRIALSRTGHPREAWMIGDNPDADIGGATAVGLPAILVRRAEDPTLEPIGLDQAVDRILDQAARPHPRPPRYAG